MPPTFRTQREQEIVEGRAPLINWKADDYAVIDGDRVIGRIEKERLPLGVKWMWSLYMVGTPNSGTTDTLEEAKAAFAEVYRQRK
jgi:hypothetical protein